MEEFSKNRTVFFPRSIVIVFTVKMEIFHPYGKMIVSTNPIKYFILFSASDARQ